jgi:two-component system, OmpR family, response regulator ResD
VTAMLDYVAPTKPLLIVEDDPALRRVLTIAMQHAGFFVDQASNGAEAVERLEQGEVSGVLLDLGLPDGRSSDVLTWLHNHEDQPPWLVLSAMDPADAVQIDDSIVGRFIPKPFDPWALIERVKDMTADEGGY